MSDRDSWTDPQSETPLPAKKKGMSGCMLAGLIVGGLGLFAVVVCCGVGIWFGSMFVPKITKVPAEVTEVGRKILNTEVLDSMSPDTGITMDNMIFTMRVAQFKHKEGKGGMMIGSVQIKMGDPAQANAQSRQFRGKFEEEEMANIDIQKTESHEITVNTQKVTVKIGEGTDRRNSKAVHTATAEFEQTSGSTFLMIHMEDDVWNEEAVLKMLEEAKPPL